MSNEEQVTELIIDASQALQGASDFAAAADQIGAASDGAAAKADALGQQVDVTTETIVVSGREMRNQARALDDYRTSTDSTYAASKQLGSAASQLQAAEAALTREMQSGVKSVAEYQVELAALRGRQTEIQDTLAKLQAGQISVNDALKMVRGQTDDVTRGWGLNRTGMMEMQAAGVNAFQALASGMSPWRVAQMEGAQVLGALAQGTQGFLQFALNPWVIGITAATAAMGFLAYAVSSVGEEERKLQTVLTASSSSLSMTTASVRDLIKELREAGSSSADARDAIVGAIRDVAGASQSDLARATKSAADFAAAYDIPVKDAEKALVDMSVNGYAAIKKLDDAHRFLAPDQLLMIAQLSEAGKKAEAVNAAFEALAPKIKDAAENSMSPMTKATNNLAIAWSDLLDRIGHSDAALAVVKAMAWVLSPGQTQPHTYYQSSPATSGFGAIGGRRNYSPSDAQIALDAQAGGAGASPEAQEWINEQTLAYQRQNQALQASVGVRAAVQAGLDAENQAMLKGADATQMATAYSNAYSAAMAKQAAAANDNLRAIALETADTLKVAAAYAQGTDAVIAAQAAMQADIAASQNAAVNKDKLTAALIKEKQAQLDLEAAQELANAKLKTATDIEALHISQITDPQVKHEEELKAQRQDYLNQLTQKYGDNVARVNDLMGQFDQQQALEDEKRYWDEVSSVSKGYADDIKNYLVDGLTGVGNSGKSMWANMWDTAMAGAKRFLVNLAATFLESKIVLPILTDIVGSNSSLFNIIPAAGGSSSLLGGLSSLSSLSSLSNLFGGSSGGLLSEAGSWISSLFGGSAAIGGGAATTGITAATSAAHTGAAMLGSSSGGLSGLSSAFSSIPVWGWIATAASMIKGMVAGSSPTSAGGVLNTLLLPSIEEWQTNPGRSLYNVTNPIGTVLRDYGVSDGIAGLFGIDPVGSALTSFGLPSFLTPGGLIGSLFGNNKPSDMAAQTDINLATQAMKTNEGDPSERSQTNIDATKSLASTFASYEQQILALTGGTASQASAWVKVGSRDGIVVGLGQQGGGVNSSVQQIKKGFSNSDEGAQQAIDWMVQQLASQLTGVTDKDIQTVLKKGGTANEIISNLTLVQTLLQSTATAADPFVTALKAVNDNFDSLEKQARDLGLSTDLLTKAEAARQAQLAELTAAHDLAGYQNVQGAVGTITDFLAGQKLSDTSSLSPLAKQALAAQQYNDLLAQVQGGDLTQTSALTTAAQNYLTVARTNYGSTAGYTSVESSVTQALASLGQSIASQQSISDQITKAIQAQTQTNVQALAEVKASIDKMVQKLGIYMTALAQAA